MRPALSARAALVLSLLAGGVTAVAEAQQAGPCSYATCAVRLRYRGIGDRRLVQGEAGTVVDKGGVWSRRIPLFEAGSDSVRFHYMEYRSHATRAGWLAILGATAVSVGATIDYDDDKALKIGVIGSGFIVGIIASINKSRSEDHLQQAIWLYNRDLE